MFSRRAVYQVLGIVTIAFSSPPVLAHEFWIDPVDATIAAGETITADLRVGENMKGSGMIYHARSFTKFEDIAGGVTTPVEGRIGDRPAVKIPDAAEGLHVIAHMTTASKLEYKEFKKFQSFVESHGEPWAVAEHRARGLPEEGFTEAYFRCAKALVKVGAGEGRDRPTGMPIELTALTNPYTSGGDVRFLLTYKGKPKPDHQVDVFFKAPDGAAATKVSYLTNASGEVSIPRVAGRYLVNSVVMEEPTAGMAESLKAVWISLWASTTYDIEAG